MWTLKDVARILRWPCDKVAPISGFAIDSRLVKKGEVFFALKGEQVDGHAYLEEVAKNGAVGAIVTKNYAGPEFGLALLRVENVKSTLHSLAKEAFAKRREQVVAITGSMGKTTTKEFVATILSEKYQVAKTPGNYNTQLTVPLTLLNLQGEFDVLVLEMGMGDHGDLKKLVQLAPPEIAVLTKIAPAGLEDFRGGLDAVAKAKSEIFSHPKTKLGIVSAQAASFPEVLYGNVPKWIYGWEYEFLDARDGDIVMDKEGRIDGFGPIEFPFEAKHLKENALAAAAVAKALGLSWYEIAGGIKKCKPFSMRFERIEREGITFINDCYNANPHSTFAALQSLPMPKEGGKTIAVLGEMVGLGSSSDHYHRQVGSLAADRVDHLLCIGKGAKSLAESFSHSGKQVHHLPSTEEIKKNLFSVALPGDVVLIKGANCLKLWEILEE